MARQFLSAAGLAVVESPYLPVADPRGQVHAVKMGFRLYVSKTFFDAMEIGACGPENFLMVEYDPPPGAFDYFATGPLPGFPEFDSSKCGGIFYGSFAMYGVSPVAMKITSPEIGACS